MGNESRKYFIETLFNDMVERSHGDTREQYYSLDGMLGYEIPDTPNKEEMEGLVKKVMQYYEEQNENGDNARVTVGS